MKRMGRLFCALFALMLFAGTAMPAKAEPGIYTIRIFSGQQGTIKGNTVIEYERKYGESVDFNLKDVKLKDDSKYYVKGIREAGKDDDTITERNTPSFRVTEDRDYVIVYGILGDKTSYTIEYVDEAGNTLAPSETYYGNVGDKPVIAYLYIEGYRPQAYNLTRTLKKEAEDNIFRFVYTPGEDTNRGGRTTERTTVVDEGVRDVGEGAQGGAAGENGADNENLTDIGDEGTPLSESQELLDLDDEQVPLGPGSIFNIGSDARLLGIPVPVVVAACGVLIGCGVWFFLLMKRRKKREIEL